jgi:lysozyme
MQPVEFIEKVEGNDSRPLGNGLFGSTWDSLGLVWNIGPGLTKGITKSTVMTQAQIDAQLAAELKEAEDTVDGAVKVHLGENQRTTLISFTYNVGVAGFLRSSVLAVLNAGNYAAVPARLSLWNKAGGKVCQGLINRRNQEIVLWNHPDDHPAPTVQSVSVPKADANPGAISMATTSPTVNSNPVVAAAVKAATAPIKSIWSTITGLLSSAAGGAAATVLTTIAPNLTGEIVGGLGIAAAVVSIAAHIYALVSGQIATNNATIALAENLLNEVENALGGKPFSFDNNPNAAPSAS